MLQSVLNAFFGCSHQRTTFPITPGRRKAGATPTLATYVACLDCGKEFPYDWQEMKVIDSQAEQRNYTASVAHKAAA